jgi:hypothetical protein
LAVVRLKLSKAALFAAFFYTIITMVTQPVFDANEPQSSYEHMTGLGDMQLLLMAGSSYSHHRNSRPVNNC